MMTSQAANKNEADQLAWIRKQSAHLLFAKQGFSPTVHIVCFHHIMLISACHIDLL